MRERDQEWRHLRKRRIEEGDNKLGGRIAGSE